MSAHPLMPAIHIPQTVAWRLLDAADAALGRLGLALRVAAERRVGRRAALFAHAQFAHLDSQTLRDIGLGDWVASASDSDEAQYRRALELRGF